MLRARVCTLLRTAGGVGAPSSAAHHQASDDQQQQQQQHRRSPTGIDHREFTSTAIRDALNSASHNFASNVWISKKQLNLLRMRPKFDASPVLTFRSSTIASKPTEYFNADQVEAGRTLIQQTPSYIDGKQVFGVDNFFLLRKIPSSSAAFPVAYQRTWYTVPEGVNGFKRQLAPGAQPTSMVMGFGANRKGLNLVHHSQTVAAPGTPGTSDRSAVSQPDKEDTLHRAESCFEDPEAVALYATEFSPAEEEMMDGGMYQEDPPANRDADEQQATPSVTGSDGEVFHVSARGVPFSIHIQRALRRIATEHGYTSNVWMSPAGMTHFSSAAATEPENGAVHEVKSGLTTLRLINMDRVQAPDTATQVSARSRHPFSHTNQQRLREFAASRAYRSNIWWTRSLVDSTPGAELKPGATGIMVEVGKVGKHHAEFFNQDDVVVPVNHPSSAEQH